MRADVVKALNRSKQAASVISIPKLGGYAYAKLCKSCSSEVYGEDNLTVMRVMPIVVVDRWLGSKELCVESGMEVMTQMNRGQRVDS